MTRTKPASILHASYVAGKKKQESQQDVADTTGANTSGSVGFQTVTNAECSENRSQEEQKSSEKKKKTEVKGKSDAYVTISPQGYTSPETLSQ